MFLSTFYTKILLVFKTMLSQQSTNRSKTPIVPKNTNCMSWLKKYTFKFENPSLSLFTVHFGCINLIYGSYIFFLPIFFRVLIFNS